MTADAEDKQWAEELYVLQSMTLAEAATETGIPESTVKRWSAEEGWSDRKRAYQRTLGEIKRNTVELQRRLTEKALETLDPQAVYAISRLGRAVKSDRPADRVTEVDRPRIFLEDMEFVAEALREIDPEGLKAFARNFDVIVARYKERHEKAA